LLLLVVPLLGAIVAALSAKGSWLARASAMAAMLVVLALSLRLFLAYEPAADPSRFDFNLPWMPALGINLHFAVDGFNVYLVLLAALLFPAVLGCTWGSAHTPRRLYLVLMLVLESSLLGTFLSQNVVLFFAFWEAVLIPAGVLILVYGGERRRRAAITFFLYTMAGSVLLLAAVIGLGAEALKQNGKWSFELGVLYGLHLDWNMQVFVFIAIMLACLVKVPLVPFHAWLPLAYYEAPASVTALLAGALSKMGAYGILKLALPLAPDVAVAAGPAMAALAVASLLYGAVLALREADYKKLIAYSSLSHMGYVVLGLFSLREVAIHGALLQMLSHGVAVAGLFALLGVLEQRLGPSYRHAAALSTIAPRFAIWLMLFVLTTVALPLTSGFTAEFLILFGAFVQGLAAWQAGAGTLQLTVALLAVTPMVLGATYMLRFARALLFGTAGAGAHRITDLRPAETASLLSLLLVIIVIGVAPAAVMSKVQSVAAQLAPPRMLAAPALRAAPALASIGSTRGK
jgi:NADH-quinone oxidoreductase subunit M